MMGAPDMRAAILCRHCAAGKPIQLAMRDEPNRGEDSGWQFLCGDGKHDPHSDALLASVDEVVSLDPTLGEFIGMPVGTVLTRSGATSKWRVSRV
jgi:hypothetical protein